jgi:hypothetical protein
MMKLPKEKRDRIILVGTVTLALSLGLWQGVIKTRGARIATQRIALQKQREQLSEAREWIERAQKVEQDMEETTGALRVLEERMAPAIDQYAWSYLMLDQARQGHQVEVVDVTRPQIGPVRLLPSFPYQAAYFTVSGRAYYDEFGRFLADFENNHPYFSVQSVELSRRGASSTDAARPAAERELLAFKLDIVALIKPATP